MVSVAVTVTVEVEVPPLPSLSRFATGASAYAARKLAASVASFAFSNCDVKIGILIATKTPMIATTTSSSARLNYDIRSFFQGDFKAEHMQKRSDEIDFQ